MPRLYGFILLFCFLFASTLATAQPKVSVAVASNMQGVIAYLNAAFEEESHVKVEINVASSGKLYAQIIQGAPYDVFVSADMKYPQELFKKGFAPNAPVTYAIGQLVLWTPNTQMKIGADLQILMSPGIRKIAMGNPKSAPYGKAAEEALKYFKMYDKVKPKLVFGESIGQTEQFISVGGADLGFIAKSLLMSEKINGKGSWVDIVSKAYTPIRQGVAVLKHGEANNKEASKLYYQFLFSPKARAIFAKYGYIVEGK